MRIEFSRIATALVGVGVCLWCQQLAAQEAFNIGSYSDQTDGVSWPEQWRDRAAPVVDAPGPSFPARQPRGDNWFELPPHFEPANGFRNRPDDGDWKSNSNGESEPYGTSAQERESDTSSKSFSPNLCEGDDDDSDWLHHIKVGYDDGFIIASQRSVELRDSELPFRMGINGWGQLRYARLESQSSNPDLSQFQLKRARIALSGTAFTRDFYYFVQLDGRSSSGDDMRLLDYFLSYDVGHHRWGWKRGTFGFKTGKYKMPFTMARYVSGREFEFSDRSMASTYFDVNRSLAVGLFGKTRWGSRPIDWEIAVFNGLVTGGAETGSSGSLDTNFAYSGRLMWYPTGEWGLGELADFESHQNLASRVGVAFANSTVDSEGTTEFNTVRVVDSGQTLSSVLSPNVPVPVDEYTVNLTSMDASFKYRGCSLTTEYYFRLINGFDGAALPDLFDHGFWLQFGKFVVPRKLQLLARWSRVQGNSGTLGLVDQSSEERAVGCVWYFKDQHAKLTLDATYLNGAPINSSSLDITPGDDGWLFRTQFQFAF